MKKCYVAGKMKGIENEYGKLFEIGKKEVEQMGYVPVSPTDLPHNHGKTEPEFLCEDFAALLECDAIYLLKNWPASPGALKEFAIATWTNKTIIFQD